MIFTKTRLTWAFRLFIAVFLLLNIVAFFHAYTFTHFNLKPVTKTKDARLLTLPEKFKILLFGINNPRPQSSRHPAQPYKAITLQSTKKITGWLLENPEPKGTIILCHGYAGHMANMLDKATVFYDSGYSVLLLNFRGSGQSEGNQTTIGYFEAEEVKAAFEFIRNQSAAPIILFGTSMGAVAIMKAMQDYNLNAAGLILECPFGTTLQTVKNRFIELHVPIFPMAYLLTFWGGVQNNFNAFSHNPEVYAKEIETPTLLLYGKKDPKVTIAETESIFNNLKGKKYLRIYPNAGHENYLLKYRPEWTHDVQTFLAALPETPELQAD